MIVREEKQKCQRRVKKRKTKSLCSRVHFKLFFKWILSQPNSCMPPGLFFWIRVWVWTMPNCQQINHGFNSIYIAQCNHHWSRPRMWGGSIGAVISRCSTKVNSWWIHTSVIDFIVPYIFSAVIYIRQSAWAYFVGVHNVSGICRGRNSIWGSVEVRCGKKRF
jgi:hypothetical protein